MNKNKNFNRENNFNKENKINEQENVNPVVTEEIDEIINTIIEETPEVIETPEVELPTDQNGEEETFEEENEETPEVIETPEVDENKNNEVINTTCPGFVTSCAKLNVRKEANSNAEVICVIDENTEVVIDKNESTEDFYKIVTAAGIEGFCMSKFINVK